MFDRVLLHEGGFVPLLAVRFFTRSDYPLPSLSPQVRILVYLAFGMRLALFSSLGQAPGRPTSTRVSDLSPLFRLNRT